MKDRINMLVTDTRLDTYAQELYDWALNDSDALKVTQFYLSRGINTHTWEKWMSMHNGLKNAYESAIIMIGDRREIGAIKRKFAEGIVSSSMHRYDPEWRKSEEWRSTLRQEKKEQSEQKIILIESLDELNKPTPESVAQKASVRPRVAKGKKPARNKKSKWES